MSAREGQKNYDRCVSWLMLMSMLVLRDWNERGVHDFLEYVLGLVLGAFGHLDGV